MVSPFSTRRPTRRWPGSASTIGPLPLRRQCSGLRHISEFPRNRGAIDAGCTRRPRRHLRAFQHARILYGGILGALPGSAHEGEQGDRQVTDRHPVTTLSTQVMHSLEGCIGITSGDQAVTPGRPMDAAALRHGAPGNSPATDHVTLRQWGSSDVETQPAIGPPASQPQGARWFIRSMCSEESPLARC